MYGSLARANAPNPHRGGNHFAMSFRALSGRTLMTLRAGLALNICSCLVKGLIPLRALVAGLLMTMIFIKPGTAKMPGPFLPTAALISPASASNTEATCFRLNSVAVAILVRISVFEAALLAIRLLQ